MTGVWGPRPMVFVSQSHSSFHLGSPFEDKGIEIVWVLFVTCVSSLKKVYYLILGDYEESGGIPFV